MRISEGQKYKLKKACECNCEYITIRFKFSYLHGEDVIALTNSQLDRLVEAYEQKKGMTIRMSKTQLAHNKKVDFYQRWLIPFPTETVLPALGVGALSGVASTGVQKLIGNGLYLKKGSGVCRIETDGERLCLGPTSGKGFETVGNGLYLMKQGRLYDGRGLILGPNSPLKKSPFLVWFCRITLRKKISYTLQNENWWNWLLLKNWWNTGNISRRERDKRNELSTKYNRRVNIIGVIVNYLGVTAIGYV